ncbi:whi5 like domain-containing protein [Hirsutella rhossiliensis]|uniref:Whi5 like domain-containing protein n=1 Tax=Hirsutella rhossiliensis TaxID=111463 RepID=A0A9P8SCT9_9HYPO|nr:whi5 like domain-containing protein [Hirsutella rhossiliensis]KAH0957993.1 whi5 like domain-containing protein [Hirsutella rhossiliensis]
MSSPWKKQPEDVVDSVLKRAQVSKIARRLQNRLALAQFKTKHGWEDLTLDSIEPKLEEEMRRKRLCDGDVLSDSSSSASDLPYPTRTLMSSPLKATIFSDAVGSSNGSSGHRKRTYFASFENSSSSPSKRFRASPTAHKSHSGHSAWKDSHQLAQSSPIKPRRLPHFTTSGGPDISFFKQRRMTNGLKSPNFAAPSDDEDDDDAPTHSFSAANLRSSPPRTPPMQTRSLGSKRNRENLASANGGKSGEEGADLLLYLAASPSPAVKSNRGRMERLTTPPPKNGKLDLPSSMMTTPGGGNLFPNTPGQGFDFADFVNITPSPAQKQWRTPGPGRTPLSVARRRLTFEEPLA